MRLSAILIVNYANINQFAFKDQWTIRAAEPNRLYFQLVDLDQCELRHLVGIGSLNQPYGIVVTCPSIDNSKVLQFIATQADVADSSVWYIDVNASQIPSSGNVIFNITEGSVARTFKLMNAMNVELPGADGSC